MPSLGPGVRRLDYRSTVDGISDWCLIEEPPTGRRTWVIVLHGHGSHADQLYTRADIRDSWLPALRTQGVGILAPNLRDNAWMCPAASADLHGLLQFLREQFDVNQFILLGGSMGGSGALIYAIRYPQDVAGVIALCPATDVGDYHRWCRGQTAGPPVLREIASAIESSYGGTPEQNPSVFAASSAAQHAGRLTMPLAIAHGCDDAIIPFHPGRALAQRLPNQAKYLHEQIPAGDHDAPLSRAPALLEWVLHRI